MFTFRVACCAGVCLVLVGEALGQQQKPRPNTVTVTAGEQYLDSHAGLDWLLGVGYRDIWAEPFEAEVLDLESTAGGLTPVMTVGGLQTLGLALAGEAHGRGGGSALGNVVGEGVAGGQQFHGVGVELGRDGLQVLERPVLRLNSLVLTGCEKLPAGMMASATSRSSGR